MKKFYGFNLDMELKKRLEDSAEKKFTKAGPLLNQILSDWLDQYEDVVKAKEKVIAERAPITEEERIKDWEWRKGQVRSGKLPVHMAEEFPGSEPESGSVFLKPGEKITLKDGTVIEGDEKSEDKDFDKSIDDSLAKEE